MLSVLDKVEIGGIKGLIRGLDSILLELFLDFDYCIDRSIVLYKYEIVVIVF